MSQLVWTEVPLPGGYESFVVEELAERGMTSQQGFVYDPEGKLEDPGQAVVIGAGNTYALNPYSVKSLQVARNITQLTGMPVVSLETVGAHGAQTARWSWRDGYKKAELNREGLHREVMLRIGDALGLYDRPAYHEGTSQSAFQAVIRTAVTGPGDGYMHRGLTLYDSPGMRRYPASLVLPTMVKVTREYDREFAPYIPEYEEPSEELLEYEMANPELTRFNTVGGGNGSGDMNWAFAMERLGAKPLTPKRIVASLVNNPELMATIITCKNGNTTFTTERSEYKLWSDLQRTFVDGRSVASRARIISPEGLLHQSTDDPKVRAEVFARSIDQVGDLYAYLNSLVPKTPTTG